MYFYRVVMRDSEGEQCGMRDLHSNADFTDLPAPNPHAWRNQAFVHIAVSVRLKVLPTPNFFFGRD